MRYNKKISRNFFFIRPIFLLPLFFLLSCSNAPENNINEGEAFNIEFVNAAVIDINLILSAKWKSTDKSLKIKIAAYLSDQIIWVRNADTQLAIAAKRITANDIWESNTKILNAQSIPCQIIAITKARQHTINVENSPNCADSEPNVPANPPADLATPNITVSAPSNTIDLDTSITFTGSVNDATYEDKLRYLWNFSGITPSIVINSEQPSVQTRAIRFNKTGTFTISLRVFDLANPINNSRTTIDIIVKNPSAPVSTPPPSNTQPLIPTIIVPATKSVTIAKQASLTFTGQITDTADNGPYVFYWNFAGVSLNGVTKSNDKTSTTRSIRFNKVGNYTIFLRVADSSGRISLNMAQIAVMVTANTTPTPPPLPDPDPPLPTVDGTIADLGRLLFFDSNLSEPPGQSCATCHDPSTAWIDPNQNLPVSAGVLANAFGERNTSSIAYAFLSPDFVGGFIPRGGQFWDGRAINLIEQAKAPFLNPVEMANTSKTQVILKIKTASYAALFEKIFGYGALDNIDTAFNQVAEAIAIFEQTPEVNPFDSKYDAVLAGKIQFTEAEQRGFDLFNGIARCSSCHTTLSINGAPPTLSSFRYFNVGLPKNLEFPFDGTTTDLGLGAITNDPRHMGKFKVPSLRNIDKTAPYGHNGVLKTLSQTVHFYNSRDIAGEFPPSAVMDNREKSIGNIGLSQAHEDDIVIFLKTLTDGFVVPVASPPPQY